MLLRQFVGVHLFVFAPGFQRERCNMVTGDVDYLTGDNVHELTRDSPPAPHSAAAAL